MRAVARFEDIVTPRLRLRRWQESDLMPFADLNADPAVMKYLGEPLSRQDSDALAARFDAEFNTAGFGLSAVERVEDGRFLGFVGIHRHRWFPDEIEIGWRLRHEAWGQGYATEAALVWRDRARDVLGLPGLISIAMAGNERSFAVMRRLGMAERERGTWDGIDAVVWWMGFLPNYVDLR